jgi:hypothetical protein
MVFCQTLTPAGSFQCRIKTPGDLSVSQISTYISKISFENYRLRDKQVVLKFDNGFDIVLLSANRIQTMGLIDNAATYQTDFTPAFILPVFHMISDGRVSAAYPVVNSKYSSNIR